MPVDLPAEAEDLLVDLAQAEGAIDRALKDIDRCKMRIARPFAERLERLPAVSRPAAHQAAAKEIAALCRGKHRSEIAHLAGKVVAAERQRARILRGLDAFQQFGESVPAIDLAVEYDGERRFVVKTGGGRNFSFSLPIVIDRGVWRADGTYQRGDAVTSDGSLWIARDDNPAHEPGKGAQWRLAVTRGRNGRDASTRHMRNST